MEIKESVFQKRKVLVFCALLCCALWGTAIPCIKIGYELFEIGGQYPSQVLFAGERFLLAGIFIAVFMCLKERKLVLPPVKAIPVIIVIGLLLTVIQYLLYYIGLGNTTGVKGSIISGSGGFFSIIIAAIFIRSDRMTRYKLLGCLFGFAGIVVLNIDDLMEGLSINWMGDGLMLASTVSAAFANFATKKATQTYDAIMITAYQFVAGGIIMIVIGHVIGGSVVYSGLPCYILICYMAFLSAVAYTLWTVLIKYNDISKVAIFDFAVPVMGVFFSAVFLAESAMSFSAIAALLLVSIGIFMINKR